MLVNKITDLIGGTPLLKVESFSKEFGANIFAKCEFFNPASSVKDRIALNMIESARKDGSLKPNSTIIEPTSGNTGIGLALVCAAQGIPLILVMPESMSIERRKLMIQLGAKLVLTEAAKGMKGAIAKAEELKNSTENAIILQQFQNPANPQIHEKTTGVEILNDLKSANITADILVAGVGTGGSISGIGAVLKKANPSLKIVALEPSDSPVLSGGNPGPHKIQGIGAGFAPDTLNRSIIDEVMTASAQNAYEFSRKIAKQEGVLVGISSGANLWAASELAKKNPGKNIITILCDTAERYLSTELFAIEN